MKGAMKARDLQRDPRFSLHSHSEDPDTWSGDARVSGVAVEITDPAEFERVYGRAADGSHLFRFDVAEVVVISLTENRSALVIESWTPDGGRKRVER